MDPHNRTSITPQSPRSPVDHFHQGDPDSPTLIRDHDLELDHGHHQHKPSVLARVKDKARKWRQTLTKNKQGDQNTSTTPAWGVSLDDNDESGEEEEEEEEDRVHVGDHDKIVLLNRDNIIKEQPNTIDSVGIPSLNNTLQFPTDSSGDGRKSPKKDVNGDSTKEYLMQKFEPGENERALSETIAETITRPGKVVEKVKEAVVSLLANNQSSPAPTAHSPIPVSTNPHEDVEEESHGRRLQMN